MENILNLIYISSVNPDLRLKLQQVGYRDFFFNKLLVNRGIDAYFPAVLTKLSNEEYA